MRTPFTLGEALLNCFLLNNECVSNAPFLHLLRYHLPHDHSAGLSLALLSLSVQAFLSPISTPTSPSPLPAPPSSTSTEVVPYDKPHLLAGIMKTAFAALLPLTLSVSSAFAADPAVS